MYGYPSLLLHSWAISLRHATISAMIDMLRRIKFATIKIYATNRNQSAPFDMLLRKVKEMFDNQKLNHKLSNVKATYVTMYAD
jgi:hypothetical protein